MSAMRWLVAGVTVVAALGGVGCSHVVLHDASYYRQGPHQAAGPDGDLPAGTKVLVIGAKNGYQQVWADNGVIAYVWPRALVTMSEYRKLQEGKSLAEQRRAAEPAPK